MRLVEYVSRVRTERQCKCPKCESVWYKPTAKGEAQECGCLVEPDDGNDDYDRIGQELRQDQYHERRRNRSRGHGKRRHIYPF